MDRPSAEQMVDQLSSQLLVSSLWGFSRLGLGLMLWGVVVGHGQCGCMKDAVNGACHESWWAEWAEVHVCMCGACLHLGMFGMPAHKGRSNWHKLESLVG